MCRMWNWVCATSPGDVQRFLRPAIVSLSLLTLLVAGGIVSAAHATTDPYIQTPHDTVPNFAQTPTIRSNVSQGNWDDATTWTPAQVPGPNDVVAILTSHTVTVRNQNAVAKTIGVWAGGMLRFEPSVNTRLKVGTLLVFSGGALEVGTTAAPVAAEKMADIIIADQALDTGTVQNPGLDPQQYGTGLLGWGRVTMHGAPKNPTFVRVAQEPKAGDTSLILETPVTGWQPGDQLFLPDTRHLHWNETGENYVPQWEELELASVTGVGTLLNLKKALAFDHLGARDGEGRLDFLPHVINRTRNVVIRSENPEDGGTRGHVFLTHRADIDIRYVRFQDLGRTELDDIDDTTVDDDGNVTHIGSNQSGRYWLYLNHVMGPASADKDLPQFTLIGNAIDGGSDEHEYVWSLALNDSHYGLVKDNVIYNAAGAGLFTESGNESENVIERNVVMRTNGFGGRVVSVPVLGTEGSAFWFRGTNNRVRDNVAANVMPGRPAPGGSYGYTVAPYYLGDIRVPNSPGADTSADDQVTVKDGNALPLLEFARNEVYGATESGMTYWWVGSFGDWPREDAGVSVIKDLRVWHVFNNGIFQYPSHRVVIDGMVVRGTDPAASACCVTGILFGDYMASEAVIRNADIQGMGTGISMPTFAAGATVVENSSFRNTDANILIWSHFSTNGSWDLPPKSAVIRNVKFDSWEGEATAGAIAMYLWDGYGSANLVQRNEVFVEDYQGRKGENFRVYFPEQRPDFIVPQSGSGDSPDRPLRGSPEAGLTNAQNWAKYTYEGELRSEHPDDPGLAVAGAVAPCTDDTTYPEIAGYVCK